MAKDVAFQSRGVGKQCYFMMTCLCDAFFDDVAQATLEILEYLGVKVMVPEGQTCCAQPAFNAGDWKAARRVIRHTVTVFDGGDDLPVVLPSGSCAHMVQHGYHLAMEKEADCAAAEGLAGRTVELCDYLVSHLGITEWPGRFQSRVALHRSCHTRGSNTFTAAQTLLRSIDGLELADFGEQEQCCGFGGTFSVAFPNISARMGELKCEHIMASEPECIAAVDMACMMHFGGMLERNKVTVPRLHVAQILRESLRNAGMLTA